VHIGGAQGSKDHKIKKAEAAAAEKPAAAEKKAAAGKKAARLGPEVVGRMLLYLRLYLRLY
jgi:hypothetical protein